jgi:sodium-dependent dicarboxylate transporter 2/3/5
MNFRQLAFFVGPLLAILIYVLMVQYHWSSAASITAATTVLCAVWWIFEPIPIPITSLIPIGLFPLMGVLDKNMVGQAYGSPLILLLLGGFILSQALEYSGAHRRVAFYLVRLIGGSSPRRVVFGFMVAAAALSMWISNTATTLMLLPVALAVAEKVKEPKFVLILLLGIAYAASIGGVGTPIGTPPNVIFMQIYATNTGIEPSFLTWMGWGVPMVLGFIPIVGWWLTRHLHSKEHVELPVIGAWSVHEVRVMLVFVVTALLWVTRKEPFGGWSGMFGLTSANDASVALMAVVALFMIPDGKGGKLLDWNTANKIPWGVLLLFAGGIVLAKAFIATGISQAIGESLSSVARLNIVLVTVVICLVVTFLTEVTSNTATTTLLMPILAATAVASNIEPMLLMIPAAMSASCAFMLPVATAPNAVVFSSGKVDIQQMARMGIVLNLFGVVVISWVCLLLVG